MTNDIAMRDEANVWERIGDDDTLGRGNEIIGSLLRFHKGEWLYGRDLEEMPEKSRLVAGVPTLRAGWVRWQGGQPIDQQMVRLAEGGRPVKRAELGDLDDLEWERDEATGQPRDPWQPSFSMVLLAPRTGELYTFASGSKGAAGTLRKLCAAYGKHIRGKPDELPVVELGADSYRHKNKAFGKISVPVLEVKAWVDGAAFKQALENDVPAGVEEEEALPPPAKRRGRPPKAKSQPHGDYAGEDSDVPF